MICRSLAIASGCRPAAALHITDQEAMLPLMEANVALNGLEDIVTPSVYNWGDSRSSSVPDLPDVILAGESVSSEELSCC